MRAYVLAAFTAVVGGCQSPSLGPVHRSAQLVPLGSCDEAIAFVRQVALERMNKQIDERIAAFERGEACAYYDSADAAMNAAGGGTPPPSPGTPSGTPTTGGGERAGAASGTNNQVAGVDEADFVKNDGKYIYLAQNGVLRIVDAFPGHAAREVSKTPLDGEPKKLFIHGDRALVYVSVPDTRRTAGDKAQPYYYGGKECTYGYDCSFTGDGTSTTLVVFDVADRAAPKKLREVPLSGALLAARRVGNAAHTVVTDNLNAFADLRTHVDGNLCDYLSSGQQPWSPYPQPNRVPPFDAVARARKAYERLRATNRDIILSRDLSGLLPSVDGAPLCTSLYRAQLLDGASFTTVVSLDLADPAQVTAASVASSPGAVYASAEALYLAVPSEQARAGGWYAGFERTKQVSTLHKFRISERRTDTAYLASGVVKGRVLNQFAMDEAAGHLRIATTIGRVPDPEVESQLAIFAETGGALVQLGAVEHIAPTEDIRSVRFDGTRAFVVTFKKTDPLYAFDLSDPAAPKITGELKIPGFSTYMHLLDPNHLLTIGYDADDHGSFAFFDGVLLQIFDVTDPKNPTLAHKHVIGTRGSSSEALTNHLAFNYFPPLKTLAVPMTICEGGDDGRYGDQLTFTGLMLFDIDAQTGIKEHGRVAHPVPASSQNVSCSNWWSQAGSDVKRSIFMDRFVYSISDSVMKVQSFDALGTDLQSLDLTQ